jgi:hypothetical protein
MQDARIAVLRHPHCFHLVVSSQWAYRFCRAPLNACGVALDAGVE